MGIAVLGPLRVDGVPGPLRHHDRVVLAVLAMQGGYVDADRLADAIWGDAPPDTWRKVVQGCVVRLRKLLGPGAIETSSLGYRLAASAETIDARRFERLVERARELLALSDPDRAAYLLDEAMSLWQGAPLVDLEAWEAGRVEADRLTELHRDAEELAIDVALRCGRSQDLLARARTLVAEVPLRERRWALLALAQYRSGQQAPALGTLREVRTVLARELGLDPGPELVALEQAILRQDPTLVVDAALPEPAAACPYRGLLPYGVRDSDAFFGRDEAVADALRRLGDDGVLAVVGASGSGKSSLVRAGVAASLARDGRQVVVVTPGSQPLDALSSLPSGGRAPALVVDQCEEVFTLCQEPRERAAFLDALVEHARQGPLVVVLRADHIGDTSEHPAFAGLVEQGLLLLGPMSVEELRRCIEAPAQQAGLLIEPGLVDLLVREVQDEPGALPLLSHALRETWMHREGRTLTVAGYRASGEIRGAVARSAEELYESLEEDQRRVLRELMLRLVVPSPVGDPVRTRLSRRLLVQDPRHAQLIDRLVRARLLTSDHDTVELAHEVLVRAWPRLREWLDADIDGQRILRHLTAASHTWESMGRPASELYRGVRLAQALEWQGTAATALTPVEQEFLEASRAEVDAELERARQRARDEARARHRTRRLAVGLAAALVVALVAAGVATRFQQSARDEAAAADAASTEAEANRLAALSRSVGALDLSLLLAAEAFRTADTPATRDGLLTSLLTHERATQVLHVDRRRLDGALAGDGRTLFLLGPSQVEGWDLGADSPTSETLVPLGYAYDFVQVGPAGAPTVAASVTGQHVAYSYWPRDAWQRAVVLDAASGAVLLDVEVFGDTPPGLAFSPDGRRLLLGEADPTRSQVREFSLASGKLLRNQRVGTAPGYFDDQATKLDPEGTTAVSWVSGARGKATLLHLRSGRRVPLSPPPGAADVRGWVPLRGGAALLRMGGEVVLYDAAGRPRQVLRAHQSNVEDVLVSPARAWAATADDTGRVAVWDIAPRTGTWSPREDLTGHVARVVALATDSKGERLVTLSNDGTAINWDMSGSSGFGTRVSGLGDRWISNRPAVVAPGETVVAPARPVPDSGGVLWTRATRAAAVFLDPRDGKVLDTVPVGRAGEMTLFGSSVSVSPDRSRVAVTHTFGTTVLDADSHAVVARVVLDEVEVYGEMRPEPVWCSAWSPDGARLLLCADGEQEDPRDGGIVTVDTTSWQVTGRSAGLGSGAQAMEFSPDGRLLAVGIALPPESDVASPNAVKLLDADTLEVVGDASLPPEDLTFDLSFSPDGSRLAVGGETGRLWVLDVASAAPLHQPAQVHHDFLQQVEWLADGQTIATTGADRTVTLYDAERGLVRASMPTTDAGGRAHTYLLDWSGDHVAAVSGELAGRSYPLSAGQWLDHACRLAGRDLTRDEWSSYLPGRSHRPTCSDRD